MKESVIWYKPSKKMYDGKPFLSIGKMGLSLNKAANRLLRDLGVDAGKVKMNIGVVGVNTVILSPGEEGLTFAQKKGGQWSVMSKSAVRFLETYGFRKGTRLYCHVEDGRIIAKLEE